MNQSNELFSDKTENQRRMINSWDYISELPCPHCQGVLGYIIDKNNGDETPYCENDCDIDIDIANKQYNEWMAGGKIIGGKKKNGNKRN